MKNVKSILSFALLLLLAVAVLTGCGGNPPTDYDGGGENIGSGETVFRFEITDADGEVTAFDVHTDEENLATALLEVGLIGGQEDPAFGFFVTCVNDVCASDSAFWALWIDGEMSMYGVSSVIIEEGIVYAFVYTAF